MSTSSKTTPKIAQKSALLFSRLRKGKFFQAYYDTERTDLDKRFGEITEFGGIIRDPAGNIVHVADYKGRISDYTVPSAYAWLVTRMHEKDPFAGDPQYILAGKIMQFFRIASHLHEAPFRHDFLQSCRFNKDGSYSYPLQNEDGSLDWDSVKIHENLKDYSVLDPQTGAWVKRRIGAGTYGYNNVKADDQWIWSALHMAGAPNIFTTHLAQDGHFRTDLLRVVEAAYAIGPTGKNGIKAAYKKHPDTGEPYISFAQGSFAEANTGFGNALRGVKEGIVLPDGSYPDFDQLHGALKDAYLTAAIHDFLADRTPDILQQMEENCDWKDVVARMMEKDEGFGNNPIMTYIDKSFPFIRGQMVTLIGTDQYRHNPKTALMFNLEFDPDKEYFGGKKFVDLSSEDYAELIREKRLFKVVRAHHSPRLLSKDMGFAAGFNNTLSERELHRRAKALRGRDFNQRVMQGLRLVYPRLQGPQRLMLPQPVEELFTFSTLEMQDKATGEGIQIHQIHDVVERLAHDSRSHIMKVKSLWLEAISPDEDLLLNDYSASFDEQFRAAERFEHKIKKLNKRLSDHGGPPLPEPDGDIFNRHTALLYKLKLMVTLRNLLAYGHIRDITHHFWFEDQNGHRMDVDTIRNWPDWRIEDAHKNGALRIIHETQNVTAPILDRIIDTLGYGELLGEHTRKRLKAEKALMHHGIPGLHGKDRWTTLNLGEEQLHKIRNNELMDADVKALERRAPGLWESFMQGHHDLRASLDDFASFLESRRAKFPAFKPMMQVRAGINPKTGRAIEAIDYPLSSDQLLPVPVPEGAVDTPARDPRTGHPIWIIDMTDRFKQAALKRRLRAGAQLCLQTAFTGKVYHVPKARVVPVPDQGGVWDTFWKHTHAAYANSNLTLPEEHNRLAVIGEGPYPLHHLRDRGRTLQSLHIPRRVFEGAINHEMAGYAAPVTGVIVRDDKLRVAPGPITLLECDANGPTGFEVTTRVIKARKLALADLHNFSAEQAQGYGFSTPAGLYDHVAAMLAEKQCDPAHPDHRVWVIDIAPPDPFDPQLGTNFYDPRRRKISAIEPDYETMAYDLAS